MNRSPLVNTDAMRDTMQTVRDLPTTRARLLYLATSVGHWRRYAATYCGAEFGDRTASWNAYADYLESVGRRIMRYTLERHGINTNVVGVPPLTTRQVLRMGAVLDVEL